MIKGLTALISKERLKELNMDSSAKQKLRKNKLNVYKYLKCVNIKRGDQLFSMIYGIICSNTMKI